MSYSKHEKLRAIAWKTSTTALPAEAKVPAPYCKAGGPAYDFCLPLPQAALNLLPEVREAALALFLELGIPWHAGVLGGPSNHLLSSQVQCVNALGQMVHDPDRIVRAFGELLGIDEVLQVEPGRYLTFEYIGQTDFFGESPGAQRIRGAHCTSVDAAFRHRAVDGVEELVLLEWKYTESYRVRAPDPAKDLVRLGRYGGFVADPAGPVRSDLLEFEHLLDEPFYQLVRQQLLADQLEKAGVAGRVRVLHVLAPANTAYQLSLARPEHRALGATVSQVWQRLLRDPSRFVSVDPAVFLDEAVTSREYVLRYADDVIHGEGELFACYGVEDLGALEDSLDFDGDVALHEEGVELLLGRFGTVLAYPFTISELDALMLELEDEVG